MKAVTPLAALVLLFCSSARAAEASDPLVAVLELKNKLEGADKAAVDASYVTDRVRAEVLEAQLPLRVMTRENMLELIKGTGKSLEQCEGQCEVETGRQLGADYVVSGELLRVGSSLKVNLKLHETATSQLLSSKAAGGRDVNDLDSALPATVRQVLAPLAPNKPAAQPQVSGAPAQPASQGAVRMVFALPPEGRWNLHDETGKLLCPLPCTRTVPRGNRYYVELDADRTGDRLRLDVPGAMEFTSGRNVNVREVPGRGSRAAGYLVGGLAVAGLIAGVPLSKRSHQTCTSGNSSSGSTATFTNDGACTQQSSGALTYVTNTVSDGKPGVVLLAASSVVLVGAAAYLLLYTGAPRLEAELATVKVALSPAGVSGRF